MPFFQLKKQQRLQEAGSPYKVLDEVDPTKPVIEVTEEFANQVLRPQGHYKEIFPEEEVKEVKTSKKKVAKKKTSKRGK